MRFLIARSMDPEKAAKMFVQWQKWRASMVPNGFIADSEVPDELEAKKIYLQGLSKNGCPVMIVKASKHFPSKDQPQFKSKFSILYCFYLYIFIFFHVVCYSIKLKAIFMKAIFISYLPSSFSRDSKYVILLY